VALDEYVPKNGEDWEKLDHAAVTLIQTGKLLKISNVAKDNPDWPKDADRLIAQVEAARAAVKERNLENLLKAGDEINEACTGCHNKYFEDQ
jgi:cytochrome c556